MHPRQKYTIPNLQNACRVLKFLADYPNGLSLKSISENLNIPRTTALRICSTLELENLLSRNSLGNYCLGSSLTPLGMRALPEEGLREMAVPILSALASTSRETTHLAMLCGKKSLLLEVCDSPLLLRVASRPGSLALIHCSATGKVFLAWSIYIALEKFMDGVEMERKTPGTLTSLAELEKEIQKVKKYGYAIDDEEYALGVRCLAAPVRDINNHVVAAVGITGASVRIKKSKIDDYAKMVIDSAAKLTKVLKENQQKKLIKLENAEV